MVMTTYELQENDILVLYRHEKISDKLLKLSDRLSIVRKPVNGYIVQINQNGRTFYMETEGNSISDFWREIENIETANKYFQNKSVLQSDVDSEIYYTDIPIDIIKIQLKNRVQELHIFHKRIRQDFTIENI